jgi:UDP-glucuronate 4-epimerase
MNVLVTGGAGFIGSHLCEQLLNRGDQVLCVDNFDTCYNPEMKRRNLESLLANSKFILFECDIRDKDALNKACTLGRPDIVVHLAARAGVRPSIASPRSYIDVNVQGTLQILETMKEHQIHKLVFASSSSVYGNSKDIPFTETQNVDYPISPYAATKRAGELLCHTYYHLYGIETFCLRFFTVYGPRQRPDLAIHKFARCMMEGKPIPYYGDGSTERDYTYVADIVHGILGAMNHLKGFDIFNLGESRTISLAMMVATLEKAIGKKAILEKLPMQPGDVQRTYASVTKAKVVLGYNPHYTFEDGITNFIDWFLKNR